MENQINQTTAPVSTPAPATSGGIGGKIAIVIVILVLLAGAYYFFLVKSDEKALSSDEVNTTIQDDNDALNAELDASVTTDIDSDLQKLDAEFQ